MADAYWTRGEVARLDLLVQDLAGMPVDPGAVRCRVKAPDGTLSLYTYGVDPGLIRDSAGHYALDVSLDTTGAWHWRWEADSPHAGAAEGQVLVAKSRFA